MTGPSTEQLLGQAAALEAGGRPAEAERVFLGVLARQPFQPDALHRLAVLSGKAGRFDRAIELLRRLVTVTPADAVAHYHLGVAVHHKGRLGEAMAAFDRAVAVDPDLAEAHVNRALLWMLTGDYDRGLPEYEWRARVAAAAHPPAVPQPMWTGDPLAGRTLLLRAEQGYGDTIQFARYAPLLAATGGRVILEVQPPLKRLLAGCPGAAAVVATGEPLPPFDVYLPLLSVMRCLGTRPATFPGLAGPLRPDPALAAGWAGRLGSRAVGRRLGLVWAGSPANTNDANRSVSPAALAPLLGLAGVRWFSLQTGPAAAALPAGVADLSPGLHDFAYTAAALAQLDGLVTVDTAVAHLAGSMGVPVWLMLPFVPDWRWQLGRPDTPWYPSARLFRQAAPGDWPTVVAAVAAALGG